MSRKPTLVERIDAQLAENGRMTFYDLAQVLYPERDSHRYSSNGGPPGCYMSLSAAIRRGGFSVSWPQGQGAAARVIGPRPSR